VLKRTVRGLLQVAGGLGAGFTIAIVLLVWRLSLGPISLGFLAPHVSEALNDAIPGVEASFDDTILVWAGWDRAIDVRIINLQFRTDRHEVAAFIPEVAFAVSAAGLARGILAPSELELFEPTFTIVRDGNGRFSLGFSGDEVASSVDPKTLISTIAGSDEGHETLHFLQRVRIIDGDIIVDDRMADRSWVTPDAQVTLRRIDGGISLSASFLSDLEDRVAEFLITANIDGRSGRIDGGVSFDGVTPSVLAGVVPEAAPLERLHMPLEGLITLDANLDGQLGKLKFDLSGGQGDIVLPQPFGTVLFGNHVNLVGEFDPEIDRLSISQLEIAFAEGSALPVPGVESHLVPISGISFRGTYQGGEDRLTLDEFLLDAGILNVTATGLVDGLDGRPAVAIEVAASPLNAEDFSTYWPAEIAGDAYNWIIPHITSGNLYDFQAKLDGGVGDDGRFEVDRLEGSFAFNDVVMTYLDSMPRISNGSGTARFDHDRIDVTVDFAQSFGMQSSKGALSFYDLSTDIEKTHIEVELDGPLKNAMQLIDREPLGLADEFGIDPLSVAGTAEGTLAFDFPLRKDLDWHHIRFAAQAEARDVNIPSGLFGLNVADAEFEVDVDENGMDLIGDLKLAGYATNINWRQEFDQQQPVRNTYTLNVWLDKVESLADLGVDTRPFSGEIIKGDMPLWLNVVENRDGKAVLSARGDLTGIEMDLSALQWRKKSGDAGEAHFEARLQDGNIVDIPSFRLKAPEMSVRGKASYAGEELALSRVELEEVKVGRTDVKGLLIPRSDGVWDADFRGKSLDLQGVWDEIFEGDLLDSGDSLLPDLSLSAQFDRIWLSRDQHIDKLTSAFVRDGGAWRTIFITTTVEDNEQLEIKLAPADGGPAARVLTMHSRDAGAVLRLLRINDNLVDGEFNLVGRFEDAQPGEPLVGEMEIQRFRVLNAPTLTKIVSVMSLTGILEALSGEGLSFERMSIPFRYLDGVLEMKSAQANGPSLGFTANGKIYTHANVVDIEGTVVPAFLLNSIFNNIPIIGDIFSGGEEGGGVFAARYTMSGSRDDPDVSVNPLSALTPGFLRNLFSIFDSGNGAGAAANGTEPQAPAGGRTEN